MYCVELYGHSWGSIFIMIMNVFSCFMYQSLHVKSCVIVLVRRVDGFLSYCVDDRISLNATKHWVNDVNSGFYCNSLLKHFNLKPSLLAKIPVCFLQWKRPSPVVLLHQNPPTYLSRTVWTVFTCKRCLICADFSPDSDQNSLEKAILWIKIKDNGLKL